MDGHLKGSPRFCGRPVRLPCPAAELVSAAVSVRYGHEFVVSATSDGGHGPRLGVASVTATPRCVAVCEYATKLLGALFCRANVWWAEMAASTHRCSSPIRRSGAFTHPKSHRQRLGIVRQGRMALGSGVARQILFHATALSPVILDRAVRGRVRSALAALCPAFL